MVWYSLSGSDTSAQYVALIIDTQQYKQENKKAGPNFDWCEEMPMSGGRIMFLIPQVPWTQVTESDTGWGPPAIIRAPCSCEKPSCVLPVFEKFDQIWFSLIFCGNISSCCCSNTSPESHNNQFSTNQHTTFYSSSDSQTSQIIKYLKKKSKELLFYCVLPYYFLFFATKTSEK